MFKTHLPGSVPLPEVPSKAVLLKVKRLDIVTPDSGKHISTRGWHLEEGAVWYQQTKGQGGGNPQVTVPVPGLGEPAKKGYATAQEMWQAVAKDIFEIETQPAVTPNHNVGNR